MAIRTEPRSLEGSWAVDRLARMRHTWDVEARNLGSEAGSPPVLDGSPGLRVATERGARLLGPRWLSGTPRPRRTPK